jgi:integrase
VQRITLRHTGERQRDMASIQRIKSPLTGSISYRVQVRVKGRPTQSETFPNQLEAKRWGAATETAIREGKHFPHLKAGKTSFAALVVRYTDSVLKDAKPKAQLNAKKQLKWWNERFVGLTLADMTPDRIAEARDALGEEPFTRGIEHTNKDTGVVTPPKEFKRTAATINKYMSVLSRMFTLAVREWRLMDRNPAADISKKKEPRGRIRFLTDHERTRLLEACGKSDWKGLHPLVLLAISTGARRGELINLKWDDVDLKVARGENEPPLGRAIARDTTNGEPRVLPLVGKALEAVRALKLQGSARNEYVFAQLSGLPGPYVHFDQYWQEALTAAQIKNFRFHDLRHTTASYLAAQGASLLEIADTLGHKTLAMVKRYAHLAQSHKVTAIEKMAKERGL